MGVLSQQIQHSLMSLWIYGEKREVEKNRIVVAIFRRSTESMHYKAADSCEIEAQQKELANIYINKMAYFY